MKQVLTSDNTDFLMYYVVEIRFNQHTIFIEVSANQHTINIEVSANQRTINIKVSTNQRTINIEVSTNQRTMNIEVSTNQRTVNIEVSMINKVHSKRFSVIKFFVKLRKCLKEDFNANLKSQLRFHLKLSNLVALKSIYKFYLSRSFYYI